MSQQRAHVLRHRPRAAKENGVGVGIDGGDVEKS